MSFQAAQQPCPCESGRNYFECCGNSLNVDLDFIADLSKQQHPDIQKKLNQELLTAIAEINSTPDLFPVTIDFLADRVELVKMSPYWYSESNFLDRQRIQGRCAIRADVQWLSDSVEQNNWQLTPFIFHSAFCGSTLMVRALEQLFDCLPLKEPGALGGLLDYALSRGYSETKETTYQKQVLSLLSRRFSRDQISVIKANDLHNAYINALMKSQFDFPVLLMYTGLNDFIFGCLKTQDRQQWIADRFEYTVDYFKNRFELSDIEQLVPDQFHQLDYAKKAAAYWSFNILLFFEIIEEFPDRVKTLDFNAMLENPLSSINACGCWLGLSKLPGVNPKIELSWLMGQHAKNLNQTYSPEQRQDDMLQVLRENKDVLPEAEALARKILGNRYPDNGLPLKLQYD